MKNCLNIFLRSLFPLRFPFPSYFGARTSQRARSFTVDLHLIELYKLIMLLIFIPCLIRLPHLCKLDVFSRYSNFVIVIIEEKKETREILRRQNYSHILTQTTSIFGDYNNTSSPSLSRANLWSENWTHTAGETRIFNAWQQQLRSPPPSSFGLYDECDEMVSMKSW